MHEVNKPEVIVRWSDEGYWAHAGLEQGAGRAPLFLGFVPLTEQLQNMLLRHLVNCDETSGMWEARLPAPTRTGASAV